MNSQQTECELCNAIKDSSSLNPKIWNTPLYETDSFIILPSIGPLVSGHVLICSKNHYQSLSFMKKEHVLELKSLLHKLEKRDFMKDCLISEHGSSWDQKGGACVIHTHLHIIPSFSRDVDILEGHLPVFDVDELDQVLNIDDPYLLNFNLNNKIKVYEAYNIPSQQIRMALCKKYGFKRQDWRQDEKLDLIKKSIDLWKN